MFQCPCSAFIQKLGTCHDRPYLRECGRDRAQEQFELDRHQIDAGHTVLRYGAGPGTGPDPVRHHEGCAAGEQAGPDIEISRKTHTAFDKSYRIRPRSEDPVLFGKKICPAFIRPVHQFGQSRGPGTQDPHADAAEITGLRRCRLQKPGVDPADPTDPGKLKGHLLRQIRMPEDGYKARFFGPQERGHLFQRPAADDEQCAPPRAGLLPEVFRISFRQAVQVRIGIKPSVCDDRRLFRRFNGPLRGQCCIVHFSRSFGKTLTHSIFSRRRPLPVPPAPAMAQSPYRPFRAFRAATAWSTRTAPLAPYGWP